MSNNNDLQPQKETENQIKFSITPEAFAGEIISKTTTTQKLCEEINSIFRPIFSDFEGCTLEINPYSQIGNGMLTSTPNNNSYNQHNQLALVLFFKDKGPAHGRGIKNLESLIKKPDEVQGIDKFRNMNNRMLNKCYELSEDTKTILEDFISKPKGKKINWVNEKFVYEITDNIVIGGQQQQHIVIKVVGLDINIFLRKMFKTEDGRDDYSISVIRPITNMIIDNMGNPIQMPTNNYLIQISRLNLKRVEELCRLTGITPQQSGSITMVKA